ncbi:MAG: tetratricopeptide repeat protein [Gammaproteobacteria bacterium]|nr:tetratricopeptide repeat protein [Gammaproteobacteria bacterium]
MFSSGAYPRAIDLLLQAVAAQPAQLEPRLQLAKACLDWVQMLSQTPLTEIEPEKLTGEAQHYLRMAEGQMGALARAHPASHHVQSLLAMMHLIHARPEEALRSLKRALAKAPGDPGLLYNQGYALMELARYPEAVTQFTRLTALHPRHGTGWHMLGQAMNLSGNLEAAIPAYRKAIGLISGWQQPYRALANALNALDRHAEAMDVLRSGLTALPENRDMNFSLAVMALSAGEWAEGWRHYACRTSVPPRPPFTEEIGIQPGRPLRIHFDQGLGDELFFLGFVPGLMARGIKIHYVTQPKLFPLLQGLPELAELNVAKPDLDDPFDMYVGDLPYLTGMRSTADIPSPIRLTPDAEKVGRLQKQLAAFGSPPYLGVTWQAGRPKDPEKKGGWRLLHKEIPPALLGELARSWPGTVVVLQRLPRPDEQASFTQTLGRPCLDWSQLNDDLTEALAGLSLIDEYVGVSNTNMHLLASLGKTARVLVPHPPEWRWMVNGDESPWFPGFKVYRQSCDKEWHEALARLAQDMKEQYQ